MLTSFANTSSLFLEVRGSGLEKALFKVQLREKNTGLEGEIVNE